MKRFLPHGFHKTDRQGRPIYIKCLGQLDAERLVASVPPERVAEYFAHESERNTTHRLPACSLASGHLVETMITILDCQGLSLKNATHPVALRTICAVAMEQENHFPEVAQVLFIVNAPVAFSLAWTVVQPLLRARTVEMIEVFCAGYSNYQDRLLELVEPENLPAFLGGACTCSEAVGGCLESDAGPWQRPDIQQTLDSIPYWDVIRYYEDLARIPLASSDVQPIGAHSFTPAEVGKSKPSRLASNAVWPGAVIKTWPRVCLRVASNLLPSCCTTSLQSSSNRTSIPKVTETPHLLASALRPVGEEFFAGEAWPLGASPSVDACCTGAKATTWTCWPSW